MIQDLIQHSIHLLSHESVSELEMFLVLLLAIAKTITFLSLFTSYVICFRIRALKACKIYKIFKAKIFTFSPPPCLCPFLLLLQSKNFFNALHFSSCLVSDNVEIGKCTLFEETTRTLVCCLHAMPLLRLIVYSGMELIIK